MAITDFNAVRASEPITTPIPPRQTAPADSPDAPEMGTPDPGQNPAALPPAAPAPPAGTQPNRDPNAVPGSAELHHGVLASIFQDLAGGKKTTWRQTENGPVPVKENLAPGEMARGILAAAITGMAAGSMKGPQEAFGTGFEAQGQQREKVEKEAQKQAQTQFQNQQSADEMTLRKMTLRLEQQRDIREAQMHDIALKKAQQDLDFGAIKNQQEINDYYEKEAERYDTLTGHGATELTDAAGNKIGRYKNMDKLHQALLDPVVGKLAAGIHTAHAIDPDTGEHVLMTLPADYQTKQQLTMKKDKNGKIIYDKNGEMIPDGSYKDETGKPIVLTSLLSMQDLDKIKDGQAERTLKGAEAERNTAEAVKARADARKQKVENQKAQDLKDAETALDNSWGRLDEIDPKTHRPYVSAAQLDTLRKASNEENIRDIASFQASVDEAQKALTTILEKTGAPTEKSPKNEQEEWTTLVTTRNAAQANLNKLQLQQMYLRQGPSAIDSISKQIRQEFTKPGSGYDEDGALKAAESRYTEAPSGARQALRNRLAGPENSANMYQALDLLSNMTTEQRIATLQDAAKNSGKYNISPENIAYLYKRFGITPPHELAAPPAVPVATKPVSHTIDEFLKNNPVVVERPKAMEGMTR